jgi:hypothetical protein
LSLYGIFRLILPLFFKATIIDRFLTFGIGLITILFASLSTIRALDIKELIACLLAIVNIRASINLGLSDDLASAFPTLSQY